MIDGRGLVHHINESSGTTSGGRDYLNFNIRGAAGEEQLGTGT